MKFPSLATDKCNKAMNSEQPWQIRYSFVALAVSASAALGCGVVSYTHLTLPTILRV